MKLGQAILFFSGLVVVACNPALADPVLTPQVAEVTRQILPPDPSPTPGSGPTSDRGIDDYTNSVVVNDNAQMLNYPEYGFFTSYPGGLLVREWRHPDSPLVVTFVDEPIAHQGGELPEVSLVVHIKSEDENLHDWLEHNIMRSIQSERLEEFPLYLNVTNRSQSRISGQDTILFQHTFSVPRQVTVIENGQNVIQISYGPIGNSETEKAYGYILGSLGFTAGSD
jgi:hypothetical protein